MSDTIDQLRAIAWLQRSRDSKSPSVAKNHAVVLLAMLEQTDALRDALLTVMAAIELSYGYPGGYPPEGSDDRIALDFANKVLGRTAP